MFFPEQQTLVAGLRKIRCALCGYVSKDTTKPWLCNCKYGIGEVPSGKFRSGEQTGCPETLAAAELIDVLTPKEFDKLIRRVQIGRRSKRPNKRVLIKDLEIRVHCPVCRAANVFPWKGTAKRICGHCDNTIILIATTTDLKLLRT